MWQVIAWVALTVLSYLLRPKPVAPSTPEPGNVETTLVDASSPVPILFGTRLMTKTNCIWYGDVGTTPIISCSGGKK
jgi:hypothetical protein